MMKKSQILRDVLSKKYQAYPSLLLKAYMVPIIKSTFRLIQRYIFPGIKAIQIQNRLFDRQWSP